MFGELGEEYELGSGVALTETVDRIQLSPVFGETFHELCGRESNKVVLAGEEHVLAFGSVSDLRSRVVAVRDGGCGRVTGRVVDHVGAVFGHPAGGANAFVACPAVDILEDRPVDGLHMRVVEVAGDWGSRESDEADFHGGFFARSKNYRIGFVELVA